MTNRESIMGLLPGAIYPRDPATIVLSDRVQEMIDMPIIGNAHSDRDLLNLCHAVIVDETETYEGRLAGLMKLDLVVNWRGCYDQAAIDEYIAETAEVTE